MATCITTPVQGCIGRKSFCYKTQCRSSASSIGSLSYLNKKTQESLFLSMPMSCSLYMSSFFPPSVWSCTEQLQRFVHFDVLSRSPRFYSCTQMARYHSYRSSTLLQLSLARRVICSRHCAFQRESMNFPTFLEALTIVRQNCEQTPMPHLRAPSDADTVNATI